jgi:tRNA pseudouridine65 synthase
MPNFKPPHLTALQVLWQDEHLIAIYKPAGWLVHRTGLDAGETRFVVQALRSQLGGRHVFPVHRLDKGTCGVLLLALDAETARRLGLAFMNHEIDKRYIALVRGWAPEAIEVDHPLRPDDEPPETPAQPARTLFKRLARLEWPISGSPSPDPRFTTARASLVEARPLTGRRHQIRRHLKHLAHPILGDATHGKGPLNRWWAAQLGHQRLWLHACELSLRHPYSGQPLTLRSGLDWNGADGRVVASAEPSLPDLRHWVELTRRIPRVDQSDRSDPADQLEAPPAPPRG